MTLANILSGISLLLAVSFGIWMKIISARAFKANDDKLVDLQKAVDAAVKSVHSIEKDIVRFTAFEIGVDKDIRQVKADVVREAQVMTNHLDGVHKKIDHIDNILEKLRDRR